MYQFTADSFAPQAPDALSAVKNLTDIPQKLLMAAFQLHNQGKVDKRLLLDDSLKPLVSVTERKVLKRSEFTDDMQIVTYLDQMIDLMHQQSVQQSIWDQLKPSYPPSVLAAAEGIERDGILQHSRIFGDAFWDDKGRPFISGDKLAAIRTGSIDSDDPDYTLFLDKVETVRIQLRQQRQREAFFVTVAEARQALKDWETQQQQTVQNWQDTLRQYVAAQVTTFADFTAQVEQATKDMFVRIPLDAEQKRLMARGINTVVTLSMMAAAVPDTPATGTGESTVSATAPADVDAALAERSPAALAATFGQCSARTPMLVRGDSYNFMIADQRLCDELMRVIPAKGATVKINDTISLRSNDDGTFHFTITDTRTRAECLTKASPKRKAAFLETWARQGAQTGNPCTDSVYKENTITSKNMNAMIEAWLYSGGQAQRPIPFSYFLSKWFLESRHGNLMDNPTTSAKGMNQFITATWVDQVLQHGERLGFDSVRNRLVSIAADIGISEKDLMSNAKNVRKLAKQKTVKTMHRQHTSDAFHSALLGSEYSLAGLLRLQDKFESGDIPHPLGAGRTEVTAKMGYICHMLGFDGCKDFFAAYAKNPNSTVKSVLDRGPYARNSYMFEMSAFKRDKQGEFVLDRHGKKIKVEVVKMTLREFTDYLENFGFDDKPMQGLQQYRRLKADALAVNQTIANPTFVDSAQLADNVLSLSRSTTSTIALGSANYPGWMRQIIPATATRSAPVTASAAPARIPSPAS